MVSEATPPHPQPLSPEAGARGAVALHAPLLVLGWATALLLAFHPMLLSGLAQVPGDLGDARLINYLLEHSWRWPLRQPLHQDFWSPPVFYPAVNTAAYSDLLLSAGPFYWCWRAAGFPADTAFQLWLLTVASLNYLTMYAFLARPLRLRSLAAALGAVLFTAGNARVAEIVHPQLYVHFYSVIAVYALVRFFEAGRPSPGARFGAFCAAWVLQIYASFYLGWFLTLGLLVAAAVACVRGPTRCALFGVLRKRWRAVAAWGLAAAALTAPLAWHYLLAAREVGVRNWGSVAAGLPSPAAWFLLDPTSLAVWPGAVPARDALPTGPGATGRRLRHASRGGLGAVAKTERADLLLPPDNRGGPRDPRHRGRAGHGLGRRLPVRAGRGGGAGGLPPLPAGAVRRRRRCRVVRPRAKEDRRGGRTGAFVRAGTRPDAADVLEGGKPPPHRPDGGASHPRGPAVPVYADRRLRFLFGAGVRPGRCHVGGIGSRARRR